MTNKVIAIVPTKNHSQWLTDCLMGLANQTIKPSILVIVDDGSIDDTWELINKLTKDNKKVAVNPEHEPKELQLGTLEGISTLSVRFNNSYGPSIARNYALRTIEQGNEDSIIAFCDSDDIYMSTKIEESLVYFQENPHCGMVYSDYYTFNEENKYIQFKESYSTTRLAQECLGNMDSLFRFSALKANNFFDETLRVCEDYDMYLSMSHKYILCHLPVPLVKIRIGNHSSTATVPKEVWQQCYTKVMNKHFKK